MSETKRVTVAFVRHYKTYTCTAMSQKGMFVVMLSVKVILKGAVSRYLATLEKSRCLRINWIPKLMVYLRLFEGTKTVSCRLALRMARMEMDWNLKKITNFFKFWSYVFKKPSRNFVWLALSDKIHSISSL